jgi:hypothetical protein
MRKSLHEPPTYLTIEKIVSGFLIIDPKGNKFHKQTLNGLIQFIETHWGLKYIISNEKEDLEPASAICRKKKIAIGKSDAN